MVASKAVGLAMRGSMPTTGRIKITVRPQRRCLHTSRVQCSIHHTGTAQHDTLHWGHSYKIATVDGRHRAFMSF